jgi:hypothetical protein
MNRVFCDRCGKEIVSDDHYDIFALYPHRFPNDACATVTIKQDMTTGSFDFCRRCMGEIRSLIWADKKAT